MCLNPIKEKELPILIEIIKEASSCNKYVLIIAVKYTKRIDSIYFIDEGNVKICSYSVIVLPTHILLKSNRKNIAPGRIASILVLL